MKLLHDTYLEQMNEELEMLNYKLDRLHEAAFGSGEVVEEDAISLLSESPKEETEPTPMNEEAYQVYTEALDSTLKSIWRAIIRFIKSIFVSSGEKITAAEAKKIIEIVNSASEDGKFEGANTKAVAQKAFYLLAGLGNSKDGAALADAYNSGDTFNYVMKNIKSLKLGNIPDDATFRVCVGAYDENMNVNFGVIKEIFRVIAKSGVDGFRAAKGLAESAEEMTEAKKEEVPEEDKAAEKTMKKGTGSITEKGKQKAIAAAAAVDSAAEKLGAIGSHLWNIFSKNKSNINFATITFVNETKPEGMCKVRLFVKGSATNIDVKGRDKIMNLRDEMMKLADELSMEADKFKDDKMKDRMMTISQTINRFFAGLTSR